MHARRGRFVLPALFVVAALATGSTRTAFAGGANFEERLYFLGSCSDGTACDWNCKDDQTCSNAGGSVQLVSDASCSAQFGESSSGCALRAHSSYRNDIVARLAVTSLPVEQCANASDPGPCFNVALSVQTPQGTVGLQDAEFDIGTFAATTISGSSTNAEFLGECTFVKGPCSFPILRSTAPFCGNDPNDLLGFDQAIRSSGGMRGTAIIEPFRSEMLAALAAQKGTGVFGVPTIVASGNDTAPDNGVCLRIRVVQPGNGLPSDVVYPSPAGRGTDTTPEMGDCASIVGFCGNGTRESDEGCDDGNLVDGDCCSAGCTVESGPQCDPTLQLDALRAQTADDDGDSVPNVLDQCADTAAAAEIDTAGCSLAQFCAVFDANEISGRTSCRRSDWRNDEPKGHAHDCKARRMPGVPSILCMVDD